MKKLVIGSALALAALTASPVFAATAYSRVSAQPSGSNAYAAAYNRDAVNGGPAVISNGKYLGWDPDPAIRHDLLRQGDPTNLGGN
jgi:hypothetical protein